MELTNKVNRVIEDSFQNNLTITFSCYNILPYLRVSIISFLKLYPHLKENIVVFDDDSTDGTKEWLEKEGIKRITWSDKYRLLITKHYSTIDKSSNSLIYLVGCLMNDIMSQVNTKYIMINDGDVVFTRPFLYEYEALIKSGHRALTSNTPHGAELYNDSRFFDYKYKFGAEYEPLLSEDGNEFVRAHQYHGLFDLEYLKSIGMLHDRVELIELAKAQSIPTHEYTTPIVDTGLDFLAQLRNNNVPNYDLEYLPWLWDSPVYHFRFKSSTAKLQTVGRYAGIDNKTTTFANQFNKNYIIKIVREIEPSLVEYVL